MKNKMTTVVFVLFFFMAATSFAKDEASAKPLTADGIVAKMKIQLELTDHQAVAVKPIIADYLAREKQLRLDEKKDLRKILTGEQLFTWNFLQNEPPHEKKKKGGAL